MRFWQVLFGLLVVSFSFFQCQQKQDVNALEKELFSVDIAFSDYSVENGMVDAFLKYCAEDGVMLREDFMPITGRKNVEKLLSPNRGDQFTLSWEPDFAKVALSGDLGYTYGIYTFVTKDSLDQPIEAKGTYVSIWTKDKEGQWKFILDSGNEGIGNTIE